jgi:hypothetical protein
MNGVVRQRKKFLATTDCTVYEADGKPRPVEPGTPLWAAINEHETRKLDGKVVPVVPLIVGGAQTWCWMPRVEFLRSTQET